jgi:hypothetical protein
MAPPGRKCAGLLERRPVAERSPDGRVAVARRQDRGRANQPDPRGSDWLVLRNTRGGPQLAFQQTEGVRPSTWPDAAGPQMFHLDTVVATREDLQIQRDRALALGATELLDRTDDQDEPLYVFADPAGHPFCIFVG